MTLDNGPSGDSLLHQGNGVDAPETVRLEDVVGDAVCHMFPIGQDRSGCGVPRSEQLPHDGRLVWPELLKEPFCARCGLRWCPRCVELYWDLWT